MAIQTSREDQEQASDLARMWQEALLEYYTHAEVPPKMKLYWNMSDIMQDTDIKKNFEKYRHSGGKVDKLRTLISKNSELIVAGAGYIAQAASAAFPPSTAILTAFTYIMKVSTDVSKDYDIITDFFEKMNTFLVRISIIEKHVPAFTGFRSHLMTVFTSVLKMCGFATKAIREKRWKKAWNVLRHGGGDEELAAADSAVDKALDNLAAATNFANLANTEETKVTTSRIETSTGEIKSDVKNVAMVVDGVNAIALRTDSRTERMEKEALQFYLQMSTKFDKLLQGRQSQLQRKPDNQQESQKGDPGLKKHETFNRVRRYFPVKADPIIQDHDIEYSMITGTGSWLSDEAAYKSWSQGTSEDRFLWIFGEAGLGKTGLAYRAIRDLQMSTASDSKAAVAYFYFRGDDVNRSSIRTAINSVIVQVARLNPSFCEKLATTLAKNGDGASGFPLKLLWDIFASVLVQCEGSRIFLIFDGLDEANNEDRGLLLNCLSEIDTLQTDIRVLLTCRPGSKDLAEGLQKSQTVEVTKDKIVPDMQLVVQARLKTFSRLHKFSNQVKRRIVARLLEQADSMLYIEHMLRRFNKIGRETLVLKELENMPDGLQPLYFTMVAEIQDRRTSDQLQTMGRLFTWFAFSKRPLTLDEANDVSRLFGQDQTFSIEEEIAGRSGRILELVGGVDDDSEEDEATEGESEVDGLENIQIITGGDGNSATLRFQNRCLREYFRAINTDQAGLRIPPNAANLAMLEMCVHMLCGIYKKQNKAIEPSLLNYAATFWAQHLGDIDVRAVSDEKVSRAINCLRLVFTNHNNVSKLFEEVKDLNYSTMFGPSKRQLKRTLNAFGQWIQRAFTLGESGIGVSSYEWVNEVKENRLRVMVSLARGHVQNWFQREDRDHMSFDFAIEALRMAKFVPSKKGEIDIEDDDTIRVVADFFPDIEKNATAHRAIANTFARYDEPEAAEQECENGLEKAITDIDRFRTQVLLAEMYGIKADRNELIHSSLEPEDYVDLAEYRDPKIFLDEYDRSYQLLEKTLSARPTDDSKSILLFVREALCVCALTQRKLSMHEEAIASIDEARTIHPEEIIDGSALDIIPRVLQQTGKYAEVIKHLEGWSSWERMAWITDGYDMKDTDPNDVFQEAATRSNNGAFLIKVYEDIIEYLDRHKSSSSTRLTLASWYFKANEDIRKAKELLYKILDSDCCINPSTGDDELSILSQARLQLSDIIYHEFKSESDPKQKGKLLEEMRQLQERKSGGSLDEIETASSYSAINLARMIRKMASSLEYEEVMNNIFSACIHGLTDTVGSNDSGSLVLLSKVLTCVPGLEKEAQTALSAIFSITDPNVNHDSGPEDSSSSDPSGKTEAEDPDWKTEPEDEDGTADKDLPDGKKVPIGDEKVNACLTGQADAKVPPDDMPAQKTVNISKNISDAWGDLIPDIEQTCDGMGEAIKGWTTGSVYLCLICANCCLCEKCYDKVQQRNKDGTWDHWRSFCGENHKYIKGPIEGWKGVTDGYMTIGNETTKFSDWLTDLKDKKWKEAWENFWRKEDVFQDTL